MEIIPAIDLRQGRVVRLYQGDYRRETRFSDDPVAVARRWEAGGAPRLHIVDLDGARSGRPESVEAIRAIAQSVAIPLQVGGGLRRLDDIATILDAGASRFVLGTAAIEDTDLVRQAIRRWGDQAIVVAVDARDGMVAVRGWTESTTTSASDLVQRAQEMGVRRFLYTDISRDGTLTEPNFAAIAALLRETGATLLASGGVASVDHLRRLAEIGVEGTIVGSALYTGKLDLKAAIAAVASPI